MYVAPISGLIAEFGIDFRRYADDTHAAVHQAVSPITGGLRLCVEALQHWF
jgi:hypothetical protein